MDTRKLGVAGEHMEVDAFFSRSRLDASAATVTTKRNLVSL